MSYPLRSWILIFVSFLSQKEGIIFDFMHILKHLIVVFSYVNVKIIWSYILEEGT